MPTNCPWKNPVCTRCAWYCCTSDVWCKRKKTAKDGRSAREPNQTGATRHTPPIIEPDAKSRQPGGNVPLSGSYGLTGAWRWAKEHSQRECLRLRTRSTSCIDCECSVRACCCSIHTLLRGHGSLGRSCNTRRGRRGSGRLSTPTINSRGTTPAQEKKKQRERRQRRALA